MVLRAASAPPPPLRLISKSGFVAASWRPPRFTHNPRGTLVALWSRGVKPPAGHGPLQIFLKVLRLKADVCNLFLVESMNSKPEAGGRKQSFTCLPSVKKSRSAPGSSQPSLRMRFYHQASHTRHDHNMRTGLRGQLPVDQVRRSLLDEAPHVPGI